MVMASPSEKLARSLEVLKRLQDAGTVAIRSNEMTRTHRERLLKNGFIREVMKGWYVPARPDEPAVESTAWYASFWGFCAGYLNERFGDEWCLTPDQSISLHVGDWAVPKQLLVRSPKGGNKPTNLLFGTSVFDARLGLPESEDVEVMDGLRVMSLVAALVGCSPGVYTANPVDMRAALAMLGEDTGLLRRLLNGGHSKVAGRLAGAFRNIGRTDTARNIVETMRSAGYAVSERDPFEDSAPAVFVSREISPYVNRVKLMWERMRRPIIEVFPRAPGIPASPEEYLAEIDDKYVTDAYHSLSIEGYRVSEELIERSRSGEWRPDLDDGDREQANALAARGYWQAFQEVRQGVEKVLAGENPGEVARTDHANWYRELFGPSVTAGLLRAGDLAGYRNCPVYIRKSMHVPPRYEAVRDVMPAFFELLAKEEDASVRVVLGHFVFVYTHPYVDGNGRMGRFLMNLMMAAGGFPWTIIQVDRRDDYMTALERASTGDDIRPFAEFIAKQVGGQAG
jgi:hypothetical protein